MKRKLDEIEKLDREGFSFNIEPDIINNSDFLGIVEDNVDPLGLGRCKIRVPRMHSEEIDKKDLPWSYPNLNMFFGKQGKGGSISIPKNGSLVKVKISEKNHNNIEYFALQQLAPDVIEFLKKESQGVHILGFDGDEDLQIFFTPTKGLQIYLKGSFINIAPDRAITIEHNGTQSSMEFRNGTITVNADSQINSTAGTRIHDISQDIWVDGKMVRLGHQAQFSAVLGEPLFDLLMQMASIIDAKWAVTAGTTVAAVTRARTQCLSQTVKVTKSNTGGV